MIIEKPKFIVYKKKVIEQYEKLKNLGLTISYSLKTNPEIGKILEKETNCFFSIHTLNELKRLDDKNKSRIIFLCQALNEEEISFLIGSGVRKFVVDNLTDLDLLLNYLDKTNKKIDLFLRAKLKENTIFTGKYYIFGLNSKEVNEKISVLRENKNIEKLGVHFHRATQNIAQWSLKYEISQILTSENLEKIDYIDIGGGFPIKYRNSNDSSIQDIFSKIAEFKEYLKNYKIEIICEPGRFISAPSVELECSIIGINDNNLVVNASVYNSAMDTLIVPLKLLVKGELQEKDKGYKDYVIKGITPCSQDIFRYNVMLKEPKIGDKIVFLNAGAYNFATDFCDLDKIETKIID